MKVTLSKYLDAHREAHPERTQRWFASFFPIARTTLGALYRREQTPGLSLARHLVSRSADFPGPGGETIGFELLDLEAGADARSTA